MDILCHFGMWLDYHVEGTGFNPWQVQNDDFVQLIANGMPFGI
jgi:hypothetical protein